MVTPIEGREEMDKARELYRRLLERTSHVKVWLSLSQFERQMITKRHLLLEAWTDFESEDGDEKSKAQVADRDLMPKRVKKRRKIETEDGSDQGWEEYFDYIFPEAEAAKPNLKLLAMAKM